MYTYILSCKVHHYQLNIMRAIDFIQILFSFNVQSMCSICMIRHSWLSYPSFVVPAYVTRFCWRSEPCRLCCRRHSVMHSEADDVPPHYLVEREALDGHTQLSTFAAHMTVDVVHFDHEAFLLPVCYILQLLQAVCAKLLASPNHVSFAQSTLASWLSALSLASRHQWSLVRG
jgi:hypothetical protein